MESKRLGHITTVLRPTEWIARIMLSFFLGCGEPQLDSVYSASSVSAEEERPLITKITAPASGTCATWITFSGTSRGAGPRDTATGFRYFWDFGDGSQSILANPSHAYTTPGRYLVSLTVRDKTNGKGQARASISIVARSTGRTYYVATTGNDSAVGSAAAPWKTLQHAVNSVTAGDTVVVRQGEYAGFVVGWDTSVPGTSQSPITFKADPEVYITSRNDKTRDGIDLEPGNHYWVLEGFNVTNADGSIQRAGIRVAGSRNVIIRHNNVQRCKTWGIFSSFAENIIIEKNWCAGSRSEHGIYVSNSADNPVVQGNISWGNRQCGIHLNGDKTQGEDGIISNALIAGNVIHDNGTGGGAGINCDGVQDAWIENNVLYNNHANGVSLYRIDGGGPSVGNTVVNNTVVMASNSRWAVNIKNGSTGNRLYNNILLNANRAHGSINMTADSHDRFLSDYNIVMNRFNPDDGDFSDMTLAEWRAERGQDRHSIIAAATRLFVNAAANDYHVLPNSPAVDAGIGAISAFKDLDGKSRPRGKGIDIGAYEF
ncbi:MAG: NosD domain-containing protein [Thermoguttaceae bacterium]